ncbi:hypothetical protein HYDPIDRAFT_44011 [Hydnomerulius pinastri MD-312]|uniref:DUF6593 domain-containing protein n=1 Tax=Hydnomerulius pinastri MD-312 TaxID=994086 RepID=A0A0C9W0L8_9AGAM|nr:hypothetical protein HYDPIDRAFT_44011 [Hydnomerulius pinastri MD-312]
MRLIFSDSYFKNTDLSDEEGHKLYTISTPQGRKQVTTISKYRKGKSTPQVMAVIEWHRLKKTLIRFRGREVEADTMLYKRPWSWGRYFAGPDGHTYKWKVGFRYCWLKVEAKHTRVPLVKYHKRNLGIRKPSHPPYLDVSSAVTHMMDHIVVTYIYMERLRQDTEDERRNM